MSGPSGNPLVLFSFESCCFPRLCLGKHQAQVVQKLDSAIHWINHYPADKYCTVHWIEIYPVDSAILPLNNQGQDSRENKTKCFHRDLTLSV